MARTIGIGNQKGGVGKTTTAVNLASALAMAGHTILLVDLDPQANATSGLGLEPGKVPRTVYDCLIHQVEVGSLVLPTAIANLSVLPASADLAGAEVELVAVDHRESILRRSLEQIQGLYDFIFMDCPPALGLLTINGFVAASSILIPVQCEYYAMEGLGRLMATLQRVKAGLNPTLEIEGILLTMYDSRVSLARQVQDEIRTHFGNKVFQTVIPRNVTLAEAPSYGRPVMLYNAASAGAQAYLDLGKELLNHGKESTR